MKSRKNGSSFPRPQRGSILWLFESIGLLLTPNPQPLESMNQNRHGSPHRKSWLDRHPKTFYTICLVGAIAFAAGFLYFVDYRWAHNVSTNPLKFWH